MSAKNYSNVNAVLHYVANGHAEGRASLYVLDPYVFDATYYVQASPILQGQTLDAVKTDWLLNGIPIGKQASNIFRYP